MVAITVPGGALLPLPAASAGFSILPVSTPAHTWRLDTNVTTSLNPLGGLGSAPGAKLCGHCCTT